MGRKRTASGSAKRIFAVMVFFMFNSLGRADDSIARAPYPHSSVIDHINWDWKTRRTAAPGSDLWPVTWMADDTLFTTFGDGGGFGGTDSDGRVALGFARIDGTPGPA